MPVQSTSRRSETGSGSPDPAVRRPLLRWRPSAALTWVVALAGVLGVQLVAALRVVGPVWTDDEIGPLATARLIAGVGEPWRLAHDSYYPGWAFVLAPLWWITQDPERVYRLAVIVSALVATLLVVPLAAIARRVGVGPRTAVAVGAVVAVAPGRTLFSGFVLTENFLMLVLATTAVLALRYAARPTVARAVLLGAGASAVFLTHGRMVPLVGATALWFAWEGVRRRTAAPWWGLAVTVVGAVVAYGTNVLLAAQLYESATGRETTSLASLVGAPPLDVARSGLGQLWYAAVGWPVVALLGVVVLWRVLRREWRGRAFGPGAWLALAAAGTLAISVVSVGNAFTLPDERLDRLAYGRYVEPYLVLLATVGLAALVRRIAPTRRAVAGVALVTAGACVAFLGVLATGYPRGAWWGPINMPSLVGLGWLPGADPQWVAASVVAVAFAGAAVLVRRGLRGRRWLAVALGAWFVLSSVLAQTSAMPSWTALGHRPALVEAVRELGVTRLAYDTLDADWVGQNTFQYWLGDLDVRPFDSSRDEAPAEVVIARPDWPGAARADARLAVLGSGDEAVWVMPGPLQDRLEARGALLDGDLDAPVQDFGATVERLDGATSPVPAHGGSMTLRLTNTGGSAWIPLSADHPHGVRAVLWWPTADGATPQLVDLGRSVAPGGSITLTVPLQQPAGVARTGVGVTLVQEGLGELTPPGEPLLVVPIQPAS